MQLEHAAKLLEKAAAATLAQIRGDQKKVPVQLTGVLQHLEAHLFEPGFNVSQLMAACRIRDNSFPILFRQHLGVPPSVYIEDARLKTAVELLRQTTLRVSGISDLLGYATASSFSRAFKRWSGLRPEKFRRADEKATASAGCVHAELFAADSWRRALVGDLDTAQAQELRRRWRLLYPQEADATEHKVLVDGQFFESAVANMVWDSIRELPVEQQKNFVRSRVSFRSPALFDLLLEESRLQGRQDRQRGIELAELALESLRGSAQALGSTFPDLSAKAWAWIGNARRLALDYPGAERAFGEAENCWAARHRRDPLVAAELFDLKAGLRVYQRRLVEAAELVNKALGEMERVECPPTQMCRVLLRRAQIADLDGRPAHAVPDLQQAQEHLPSTDSHLKLALTVNLTVSLTFAGRYEEANQYLPRAESLCTRHDYQIGQHLLCWLRGLIAKGCSDLATAEQAFLTAQSSFSAIGETCHAAFVSLDLALLYLDQKRHSAVIDIATALVPAFESLQVHRQALSALRLLQGALEAERLSRGLLQQLQSTLRFLIHIPRIQD